MYVYVYIVTHHNYVIYHRIYYGIYIGDDGMVTSRGRPGALGGFRGPGPGLGQGRRGGAAGVGAIATGAEAKNMAGVMDSDLIILLYTEYIHIYIYI